MTHGPGFRLICKTVGSKVKVVHWTDLGIYGELYLETVEAMVSQFSTVTEIFKANNFLDVAMLVMAGFSESLCG